MGRKKLQRMLSWGWRGIEVWNTLFSLGIPAVLRAIFRHTFADWTWYDQALLFTGAFLIILSVLIIVINKILAAPSLENERKSSSSWLEQVLKGDIGKLTEHIYVRAENWDFQQIHATEPRFSVLFEIINSTVFDFIITGLTGNMEIQSNKCHMPPEIRQAELKHGEKILFWIDQRVTKETVDLMVSLHSTGHSTKFAGYFVLLLENTRDEYKISSPTKIPFYLESHQKAH